MKAIRPPQHVSPAANPAGSGRQHGFSAIELLGVLTIMAMLAGMALMSAQQQVKLAGRESEGNSMNSLADAMTNRVKASLSIPSPANWQPLVAERIGISAAEANVNRSGNSRVLLADPAVVLGEEGQTVPLPYAQSVIGSRRPRNVRFILLSSLTDPIPASVVTTYGSASTFAALWNTAEGTIPTGWPTSWKGDNDDLQIRRIDLTGLFHRLVLYNLDINNEAKWTLEAADDIGVLDAPMVVSNGDANPLRQLLGLQGGGLATGFVQGYGDGLLSSVDARTLVRDIVRCWTRGLTSRVTGSGSQGTARTKTVGASLSPATVTAAAEETVEGNPDAYLPRAIEMWVLDGTGLSLLDTSSNLAVREIVRRDASYVFEDGRWHWHLNMGLSSNNTDPADLSTGELAQLVDAFLEAPGSYSSKYAVVENLFLWFREARFWGTEANYADGGNGQFWWDRVNDYRQLIINGATPLP
jgi:prepilin-type N-terminal cleavage/methylation domain-containing protein